MDAWFLRRAQRPRRPRGAPGERAIVDGFLVIVSTQWARFACSCQKNLAARIISIFRPAATIGLHSHARAKGCAGGPATIVAQRKQSIRRREPNSLIGPAERGRARRARRRRTARRESGACRESPAFDIPARTQRGPSEARRLAPALVGRGNAGGRAALAFGEGRGGNASRSAGRLSCVHPGVHPRPSVARRPATIVTESNRAAVLERERGRARGARRWGPRQGTVALPSGRRSSRTPRGTRRRFERREVATGADRPPCASVEKRGRARIVRRYGRRPARGAHPRPPAARRPAMIAGHVERSVACRAAFIGRGNAEARRARRWRSPRRERVACRSLVSHGRAGAAFGGAAAGDDDRARRFGRRVRKNAGGHVALAGRRSQRRERGVFRGSPSRHDPTWRPASIERREPATFAGRIASFCRPTERWRARRARRGRMPRPSQCDYGERPGTNIPD